MLSTGSRFTMWSSLLLVGAVSVLAGCRDESPAAPAAPIAPVAARIVSRVDSVQLLATAGMPLGVNVAVQVQDAQGAPVSGATVAWTAFDGGSAASATSVTDTQGIATVAWTMGTAVGFDTLQASVGANVTTYIVSTVQAGPVAQLIEVGGDQQVVSEGGASQPLVVKAADQFGNPVSGVSVTWLDENGGVLSGTTSVTDANGLAQVILTADLAPEQYVIVAQVNAVSVTFVETSN